ncbi:MAG: 50S ribosomal protein L21 [Desulfobacteraceae bacterium]
MYAIVQTGGKQYRISPQDIIRVEKLSGELGDEIVLDQVLMVAAGDEIQIGQPRVEGASVVGQIIRQGKGKKVLVFKMKRRKGYRRKRGHRQLYTALQVKEIRI